MEKKKCTKCGEVKELSEFYKYSNSCKHCIKEYYNKNKEKKQRNSREYYNKNKEKKQRNSREYYHKNKKHRKQKVKEYQKQNKEKLNEYMKEYRKKNRKKLNEHQKKRRKEDSLFYLRTSISVLISITIKRNGYSKKSKTHEILGCDYETFMLWLDMNSFYNGVDRQIDHVIPVSLANTEEEVYLLNHYTNFQYLSSEDNMSKGNRYIKNINLQRVYDNHPQPDKLKEVVERSQIEII